MCFDYDEHGRRAGGEVLFICHTVSVALDTVSTQVLGTGGSLFLLFCFGFFWVSAQLSLKK